MFRGRAAGERPMRRVRLIVGSIAVVALAVGVLWRVGVWPKDEFRLPVQITIAETVADLGDRFGPDAVVHGAPNDPVRKGYLQPAALWQEAGGRRPAILTPPPARVRFRVQVPPESVLTFGVAVAGSGKRDPRAAGVRFTVEVDGRE